MSQMVITSRQWFRAAFLLLAFVWSLRMTLSYRYLIDGPSLVHPEPDRLHAAFSIVITCALFLAFMAYVWILARRRRMRS